MIILQLQLLSQKIYNPQILLPLQNFTGWQYLQRLYTIVLRLGLVISCIVFLLIILLGAVQWVTSQGNKEAIVTARARITNGIVGLIILFLVFFVIQVINFIFHINLGGLGLPILQSINLNPRGQFANLSTFNPTTIVTLGISLVIMIAAIVFFFMLIMGGLRWITSGGERAVIEVARRQIRDAIIGLLIVLVIFFLMQFINGVLGINMGGVGLPVCWGGPPASLTCPTGCNPVCNRGVWSCGCPVTPTLIPTPPGGTITPIPTTPPGGTITPTPTGGGTASPTPTTVVCNSVLNSASDQSCDQRCMAVGCGACQFIRTGGTGEYVVSLSQAGGCTLSSSGLCNTVMYSHSWHPMCGTPVSTEADYTICWCSNPTPTLIPTPTLPPNSWVTCTNYIGTHTCQAVCTAAGYSGCSSTSGTCPPTCLYTSGGILENIGNPGSCLGNFACNSSTNCSFPSYRVKCCCH